MKKRQNERAKQKMESTREPEPNKTKEIIFYGYSMKAPLNDTPSATTAAAAATSANEKIAFRELGQLDMGAVCMCVLCA